MVADVGEPEPPAPPPPIEEDGHDPDRPRTAPGHGGYGWLISRRPGGWWWPHRASGPLAARHGRRRPGLRARRAVRAQRGRRARPHRLRHPPARDPRRVRARPPGRAHPRRRRRPSAALLLQVPIGSMADRHSRVSIAIIGAITWGVFSLLTGLATGIVMLAIVRSGSGHRQGDRRPHPQLADRRLLRARPTGRGCTRSTAPPTRSAPSSGRSPPACSPTGSAGGCRSSSSPSPPSSSSSSPSG